MKTKLLLLCLLVLGTSCASEPEAVREWTAADHAHPPDNMVDPTRVPQQERPNLTVGALLWQGQCARCHGPDGRGGPQVPVSFASTQWQSGIDDAAMARTITVGKAPVMPAFGDLLSATQIKEVVKHIRTFAPE